MTVRYDTEGKVTGYGDRNGAQVIWFDYNAEGWIEAVRDAEGRQISYTYDSNGRLWKARDDVLDEETTYTYDDQGRLTQVLKPGGRESNITYNDIGNVVTVQDEEGQGYLFDYDYDDYREEYYTMIISPSGTIKEVWYDKEGKTKRVDIDGTTGQTITQDGNALITTDEHGEKTRREYDEWNNLTKVIYSDGSERSYEYEHTYQQHTRFMGTDGSVTQYEHDETGLLIRRTTDVGTVKERTKVYTYTEDEKVKTITVLGDETTPDATKTYEYNDLGKIQTIIEPDGDIDERTYYRGGLQHGKLHTMTKNNEKVWEYTYDDEGNLLRISGPHPVTTTP